MSNAWKTVEPIWLEFHSGDLSISNANHTKHAKIDLLTLELLILASEPVPLQNVLNWFPPSRQSAAGARLGRLTDDGFIAPCSDSSEDPAPAWWNRFGKDARRLSSRAHQVKYLPNDSSAIAYKSGLDLRDEPLVEQRTRAMREGCIETPALRGRTRDFWEILEGRRSVAEHTGVPVSLESLHHTVDSVFRVRSLHSTVGLGVVPKKVFPSAGGRHELRASVLHLRSEGNFQMFDYDELLGKLTETDANVDAPSLDDATGNQGLINNASAVVVINSDLRVASWKYRGPSGFLTSYTNLGFAGQALLMTAHANGLCSRLTDSVKVQEAQRLLKLPEYVEPRLVVSLSGGCDVS